MTMSNCSVPQELTSEERAVVVAELERLQTSEYAKKWIRFFELSLPGQPPLFIKHCGNYDVFAEASTQVFFHTLSSKDSSAPRVPRVLDVFCTQKGDYFLVMESVIEAKTLDSCGLSEGKTVQLAALAVKWLHDQLPSVPNTLFGRISSSEAPVWHPFFKDHRATRVFPDADALANYVSLRSRYCYLKTDRLSTDEVLNIFGDHRQICHSDIKPTNFLINRQGVWIVDFEHISVLPEVFQTYAFFNIGLPFASKVGIELKHKPTPQANAMVPIANLIQASSG